MYGHRFFTGHQVLRKVITTSHMGILDRFYRFCTELACVLWTHEGVLADGTLYSKYINIDSHPAVINQFYRSLNKNEGSKWGYLNMYVVTLRYSITLFLYNMRVQSFSNVMRTRSVEKSSENFKGVKRYRRKQIFLLLLVFASETRAALVGKSLDCPSPLSDKSGTNSLILEERKACWPGRVVNVDLQQRVNASVDLVIRALLPPCLRSRYFFMVYCSLKLLFPERYNW